MKDFHKPLLITLGCISFILGVIGALLPVVPTTPFMILAAYLFSKSSPRLQQKIMDMPAFGPLVRDWHENRVIKPRAKAACIFTIAAVMTSSGYAVYPNYWLIGMLIMIGVSVSVFVMKQKSS